jgi:hypothetical protein
MLDRGQGTLREFMRAPEESDSSIFEQEDMNVGDLAGDFDH